jgi:hypothetical protein
MTPPGFDADATDGADSARSGVGSAQEAPPFARGDHGRKAAVLRGWIAGAGAAPREPVAPDRRVCASLATM